MRCCDTHHAARPPRARAERALTTSPHKSALLPRFALLPTGQIFSNGSQMCVDMSLPPPPPPPPFEWTYVPGLLAGADALPPATMAIADAQAACAGASLCYGISWSGPLNPAAPQLASFLSALASSARVALTCPHPAPLAQVSFKTSTVPQGTAGSTLLRCGVQTPC